MKYEFGSLSNYLLYSKRELNSNCNFKLKYKIKYLISTDSKFIFIVKKFKC